MNTEITIRENDIQIQTDNGVLHSDGEILGFLQDVNIELDRNLTEYFGPGRNDHAVSKQDWELTIEVGSFDKRHLPDDE